MSKKFRVAFRRTLCRCFYDVDELIELSTRSKSVYFYSDRSPFMTRRVQSTASLAPSSTNLPMSRSGSAVSFLQTGGTHMVSNRLTVSRCLVRSSSIEACVKEQNGQRRIYGNDTSEEAITPKRKLNIKSNAVITMSGNRETYAEYEQEILVELGTSYDSHTLLCKPDIHSSNAVNKTKTTSVFL